MCISRAYHICNLTLCCLVGLLHVSKAVSKSSKPHGPNSKCIRKSEIIFKIIFHLQEVYPILQLEPCRIYFLERIYSFKKHFFIKVFLWSMNPVIRQCKTG